MQIRIVQVCLNLLKTLKCHLLIACLSSFRLQDLGGSYVCFSPSNFHLGIEDFTRNLNSSVVGLGPSQSYKFIDISLYSTIISWSFLSKTCTFYIIRILSGKSLNLGNLSPLEVFIYF